MIDLKQTSNPDDERVADAGEVTLPVMDLTKSPTATPAPLTRETTPELPTRPDYSPEYDLYLTEQAEEQLHLERGEDPAGRAAERGAAERHQGEQADGEQAQPVAGR